MTYRLRNIAIAVALAVLAAMMTSFYVKQQKQDIQQGQVLTTVWVAKSDIPAGSVGDDISGQLESTEVAKSSVTPGAIVQPEDLAGKVSSEAIFAGEQVSLLRFSTQEEQGIRAKISGNLRAVQLPGDANQLLVGTLTAGDHVDVVGSWQLTGVENQKVSRIVLRDILVLQAPEASTESQRAGSGSAIRDRYAARRSASNMFCPSDVFVASVPIARFRPASSIARAGATPEPIRRLLIGLWTTLAPASARRAMSCSSIHMPCAALKFGPVSPSRTRCSTMLSP